MWNFSRGLRTCYHWGRTRDGFRRIFEFFPLETNKRSVINNWWRAQSFSEAKFARKYFLPKTAVNQIVVRIINGAIALARTGLWCEWEIVIFSLIIFNSFELATSLVAPFGCVRDRPPLIFYSFHCDSISSSHRRFHRWSRSSKRCKMAHKVI